MDNKKFFMPKSNKLVGQAGRSKNVNKLAYYIVGLIGLSIFAAFAFSSRSNAIAENAGNSVMNKLNRKQESNSNSEEIRPKNMGLSNINVKDNSSTNLSNDDEQVKKVLEQEAKERQNLNNTDENNKNLINGQNPYTASSRIPINPTANIPQNINATNSNMPAMPSLPNLQEMMSGSGNTDANMQSKKESFTKKSGNFDYLDSQLQQARSELEIKAGTVIPCVLANSINSDLPGIVNAVVSEDVYDSISHSHIIIPKGTRVNGIYDSNLSFGQNGLATTWNRLVFSDGSTFDIGSMTGADQGGNSGFRDKVNNHYARTFGSSILVAIIGSGMQLSQPKGRSNNSNDAQETITANLAQQTGNTAQNVLNKTLNVQPTITIKAGYRFNVMVNKDFVIN